MPIVPEGIFETEKRKNKIFIYPKDQLGDLGVYFVAENQKDSKVLIHDDGSILTALSAIGDPVYVVKELRRGSRALGFVFKDGRVLTKCNPSELVGAARRLERLAAEIAFKMNPGGKNGA